MNPITKTWRTGWDYRERNYIVRRVGFLLTGYVTLHAPYETIAEMLHDILRKNSWFYAMH